MWHFQYLLNKQENLLENLSHLMLQLEKGIASLYRHDIEGYQVKLRKISACTLSYFRSMYNDLIGTFEIYAITKYMWNQVKIVDGWTSITRLRANLIFVQYIMDPKYALRTVPKQEKRSPSWGQKTSNKEKNKQHYRQSLTSTAQHWDLKVGTPYTKRASEELILSSMLF